jgi:hypothetical protein
MEIQRVRGASLKQIETRNGASAWMNMLRQRVAEAATYGRVAGAEFDAS